MARRASILRYFSYALLLGLLGMSAFTLYLDLRVKSEFEGRRFALPARIYARPLELHVGLHIASGDVEDELKDLGYAYAPREAPGWYVRADNALDISVRPFLFADGPQPTRRVRVTFDSGTVSTLTDAEGRELALARLEPVPIGGIYAAGNEDRVLVRLRDVPPLLVKELIATEDHNYYTHHGFDPRALAARALERRNLVLRETKEQGSLSLEEYAQARGAPLGITTRAPTGTSPYPAFVQLVHRQLRRDYDEADLRSEGLRIFTTLDPRVQGAAERALAKRLAQFDKEKRFGEPGLEGAIVVTDPQSGEVQALVGGRDARYRGYNRALDAARPVGSLLKPAIYLTALSDPARYTLVTPLDDGPFVWKSRGAPDWQPANYDKKFHGIVPLRTALAQAHNAATARLGTELGIDRVIATVQRLGVDRELRPLASTLLGAAELSPLEVAQMYQTIAAGGFRSPLRAIREVTTPEGKPLLRYALKVEQAFPAEPIYLITAALQGVVREGTAQGLRSFLPAEIGAAGKTGTTDEQRDAWFAGFTGDHLGVVWIGYDDNRAARLLGATAALPVWGDMMSALAPQPLALPKPDAIEQVWIDPQTNLRGDSQCTGAVELPFMQGTAPRDFSPCASPAGAVIDAVDHTVQK